MSHEMIKVEGVWECPQCPRRLCWTDDGHPVVLEQGNTDTSHFGTTNPDLRLGSLEVKPHDVGDGS